MIWVMNMIDWIINFFTQVPLWELILILVAKVTEVAMGTMRVILIGKGFRKPGTVLAIFEILLWVFVASTVINGISEAPIKGLIYSIGFAIGVYIGSLLENKLAVGKILIHVIASKPSGENITKVLRSAGHGVTVLNAKGMDSDRSVLMIFANRKNRQHIMQMIEEIDSKAVVVSNEVSLIHGGYVSPLRYVAK